MFYQRLGQVPPKRHTVFRQPHGGLYYEHLMGNKGFSGPASLLYHTRRPTTVLGSRLLRDCRHEPEGDRTLRMRHFHCDKVGPTASATLDRSVLLFNHDVSLGIVQPTESDDFFYRNAQADEVLYVSEGAGVLESQMGSIAYRPGDYLIIPRGILYRLKLGAGSTRLLTIESAGWVRPPSRYCNERGQFLEHSPYCERDIRGPAELPVYDELGEYRLVIKQYDALSEVLIDHHPFDVIGWDGYYYPFALSIHDFEPITGSLHQPPPVHQTFQGDGFVICSFVPRMFDYHPQAIPAPYNHSNVHSDEVLYYANDQFMSRKGVGYGSMTLHPEGLPHGPQPGRTEDSIGKKRTEELAVMLDTFRPLVATKAAAAIEDPGYARSWLEGGTAYAGDTPR